MSPASAVTAYLVIGAIYAAHCVISFMRENLDDNYEMRIYRSTFNNRPSMWFTFFVIAMLTWPRMFVRKVD